MIALGIAGLLFTCLSLVCFVFVLVHAFGRSLGAGFMVLCIPFYQFYYGFRQFEHRRKGLLLAGWMGGLLVGAVLRLLYLAQRGAS